MIDLRIDPNDWEEHRRLSFALAMRAEGPATLRAVKQLSRALWAASTASPERRVIALSLLVMAALLTADLWATRTISTSLPGHIATTAAPRTTEVRLAPAKAASDSSLTAAASPF